MSEALVKFIFERKSIAFVISLLALVALCGAHKLDSSGFATAFSSLVIAFMGATAYAERSGS